MILAGHRLVFPRGFWYALIAVCLAVPASGASVNVPLDHWSYHAIDRLIGLGVIRTALQGTKPFTRDEMARLIVEAISRNETLPGRQRLLARPLLRRLVRAFQDEVKAQEGQDAPTTFLKPLADASVQFVHVDGEPARMIPVRLIDATEGAPLVRNNEGIDYRDGLNAVLTTTTYGKLWNHFAFFLQPLVSVEGAFGDETADVRLQKGYAKAHLGPFEIEFGRDAVRWGQGFRGTLVFSNHARPLDFVQVSTPHPVQLPWIFRSLGLIKVAAFFAVLEEDRDVSRAKLVGARLQIKPVSWLELGVVGGVQFDGEGVPGLDWGDVGQILRFGSPEGKTNQIAAIDLRLTLPFLRYTEFYVEYGAEDTGNLDKGFPSLLVFDDVAFLVGLYVPRLTNDGRTTFRFEWMQNTFSNDSTPSVWYGNSTFTSGFTFKERVLGHATGGDSAEFFGRLTREFGTRTTVGVDGKFQWRGDTALEFDATAERERRFGGGLDVRHFFTDAWEVNVRIAVERVENFNLRPGDDRINSLVFLQMRYHVL